MSNEYWDLVFELVPDRGEARTIQGEVVRAVLRLTAECARNGCGNWDHYYENLTDFAIARFDDGSIEPSIASDALAVLNRLRQYGRKVRISDDEDEDYYLQLCRDLDDYLEIAAVDWCKKNTNPIQNPNYDPAN